MEEMIKKLVGETAGQVNDKNIKFRYESVSFSMKGTCKDGTEFSCSGMNPENVLKGFTVFKKMIEEGSD